MPNISKQHGGGGIILNKRRDTKISYELLGILLLSLASTLLFYGIIMQGCLLMIGNIELYWKETGAEEEILKLQDWMFSASMIMSFCFFLLLFLILVGIKLSYIEEVVKGIRALQQGRTDYRIVPEGRNELTSLAESVNYLAITQRELKEKEERINKEKEQLIRTLSHDIRTPLTAILSYAEYLLSEKELDAKKQREQIEFMQKKAKRIKELTDILLDGGKRRPELFDNAKLLWQQLFIEFEEGLEEEFKVEMDFSDCPDFSGKFDVGELQRIMENLSSNIKKYADSSFPIIIKMEKREKDLILRQKNKVREKSKLTESYQVGITSIQRIAYHYQGEVKINSEEDNFEIEIVFSEF